MANRKGGLLQNVPERLLKVGDKVRIRSDLAEIKALFTYDQTLYRRLFPRICGGDYNIAESMEEYVGRVVTIKRVSKKRVSNDGSGDQMLLRAFYDIEEDGGTWSWRHGCFEKIDDVEIDGSKWELPLKVGTKVRIRKNLKEDKPSKFKIRGESCESVGVVWQMERFSGYTATITNAMENENIVGEYAYEVSVDGDSTNLNWDISMFDGFNSWWEKQEKQEQETESEKDDTECKFPLKVGDLVKIREDFKKRVDKNGCIWSTINGRRYKSFWCASWMLSMDGRIAKITKVVRDEDHIGGFAYKLQFFDGESKNFDWDISMFECFDEWADWKFGGSKKKKDRKANGKSQNGGFEYKQTIKLPDFHAYDYRGRKREFENFSGRITKIEVTIISGDETGLIYLVDNGKQKRVAFDAGHGSRFIAYDDGSYAVEGDKELEKWLTWTYDEDKAGNVNYAIQRMNDFLKFKGEK